MEPRDVALLDSLLPHDEALRRLLDQHHHYEVQIDELARRRWLSTQEDRKLKELKKLKLRGRDQIERILAQHRSAISTSGRVA